MRFRYRANFAGYLYVVNRSTSGKVEQLFPREETGQDNRIAAGKQYTIPSTDAIFRIAGPAGHELIYWLASPVELGNGAGKLAPETVVAALVETAGRTDSALRRCHFPRARGLRGQYRRAAGHHAGRTAAAGPDQRRRRDFP